MSLAKKFNNQFITYMERIVFLVFLIFFVFLSLAADLKTDVKNNKKEAGDLTLINKRISYLEKKVSILENRIKILEKKLKDSEANNEIKVSLISSQVLRGTVKEGIKFDIAIENRTKSTLSFIFGRIEFTDMYSQTLYSDNFYFDEALKPNAIKRTVMVIESSNPSYTSLAHAQNIRIKFTPIKIIKQENKHA